MPNLFTNHSVQPEEKIRGEALQKLRVGDYDFASKSIQEGKTSLDEVLENLKIYQAELEIQNDELRQSQLRSEGAMRDFMNLFASLPLPALVIDEMGIIQYCNGQAEERFQLNQKQLINHYFPRFFQPSEHNRLRKLIDCAKANGNSFVEEIKMRSATGECFVGDVHMKTLPDELRRKLRFAAMIVDQTENVAQRRVLLKSERIKTLARFRAYPAICARKNAVVFNSRQ